MQAGGGQAPLGLGFAILLGSLLPLRVGIIWLAQWLW
jgi:hypothetical protein